MTAAESIVERERGTAPLGLLVQLPLAAFFGWLLWAFDEWMALSLDVEAYPWVIAASTGLLALPWIGMRRLEHLVVPCAWLAFLLLLPGLDNNALKPLLRTAYDLPVGTERDAILARIFEVHEGTPFNPPVVHSNEAERLVIKPRRDPGFSAECLIFTLKDDRLVRTSFSAD